MAKTLSICGIIDMVRVGSDYGGYWIPRPMKWDEEESPLPHDLYNLVYDAGVGEDISFSLELSNRMWTDEIHLFDPTKKAANYWEEARRDILDGQWKFHNFGIASEDGPLDFYPPVNPAHVSYSAENIQGTVKSVEFQCYSLDTVSRILGHDQIGLLKLDIEGTEYKVLSSMLFWSNIRPYVVVVEFHTLYNGHSLDEESYIKNDLGTEYQLIYQEGQNHTYLRKDIYARCVASHKK